MEINSEEKHLFLPPNIWEDLQQEDHKPDWKQFVFSFLPEEKLKELPAMIEGFCDPYANFLRGLVFEEGVYVEKNWDTAKKWFEKGVQEFEPFCSYRMYFYYREETEKPEKEKALLCLLKAFAVFDDSEDQRFAFNPINSFKKLLAIFPVFVEENLKNYFKESKEEWKIYLKNVLNFRLMNKAKFLLIENKENNILNSLSNTISELADNSKHTLSLFFLASYYYYYEDNNETASELLEVCYKQKLIQGYYLYSNCLWENKEYEKAVEVMRAGAEGGCYRCINVLASQIINNYIFKNRKNENYIEAFNLFLKAAILGDFWSFDYAFFIFSHIFAKNSNDFQDFFSKTEKMIYNFCETIHISYKSFNAINSDFTEHGGPHYLLGYCLYKGIGCKANLRRSVDLMLQGLNDPVITNQRVLYRYLWKAFKAYSDKENEEKFLKLYLEKVNLIEKKFPQHTYFLAKYYFTGTGFTKDVIKAYDLAEEASGFRQDYMFFCPIYYKERANLLKDSIVKEESEMIAKVVRERKMCLVCQEKEKITMFFPCKHKACCLDCGSKVFGEGKNCVVCENPIGFLINSTDI